MIAALTALVIAGLFVPAAYAVNPVVTGNLSGDPVNPGEQATLTFTISPSQRTLASFTLTPPANWQLAAGSPSPGAPAFQVVGNALVASGLSVSPSGSATVQFAVKTGCVSGNWNWGLVARDSQGRIYGNGTSDLSTQVHTSCSLGFVSGRQPSDALKDTLITGTAFNASSNFVQVELLNGASQRVSYFPVDVSFDLATGAGLASGTPLVTPRDDEPRRGDVRCRNALHRDSERASVHGLQAQTEDGGYIRGPVGPLLIGIRHLGGGV